MSRWAKSIILFPGARFQLKLRILQCKKREQRAKRLLWPRGLGRKLGASSVIDSTFLDYCFVIFPAGHHQLGKRVFQRMPVCCMLAGQCCSQGKPMQPMGCIPQAGRVQVAAHSTCCPTASCPCWDLMCQCRLDAVRWRGASSFTMFVHGSVTCNCFQISCPDCSAWLGSFKILFIRLQVAKHLDGATTCTCYWAAIILQGLMKSKFCCSIRYRYSI